MPPSNSSDLPLLKAFEGALREGRLLDETISGLLDAGLLYFDAAAAALLPAGGAPPMTRAGRSIVAAAAEQRLSRHLEDVLTQGREQKLLDSGLVFHGAPVKVADQVHGAFGVGYAQVKGRETELEEGVRVFARALSHILDRDRTVSTLVRRREEAVALFELASGALHSLNAGEVIRLTVVSLARQLEFDRVQAWRYDPEAREVEEILAHGGPPPSSPGRSRGGRRPIEDEDLLARCLASHGPTFDDDETGGVGPTRRRQMALPISTADTVFGFLTVSRRGSFVLTPQEMRLAQELARLAAGALEKGRLIEAERRNAERIAFVGRLHAALGGLTEVGAVLQRTVKELGPHFDLDLCAIRLAPTGELPGASALYTKAGDEGTHTGEEVPDALRQALSAEGAHVLLVDAPADPRGITLIPAPELVRHLPRPISLLAVPLAYRGGVVGVLAAVGGGRPQGFGVGALRAFEAVAVEVSLAVTTARLLQKERDSYRFLDRMREAGRSLMTTFDAPRIKQILCESCVTLLKADVAHFWDADPASKSLQVSTRWGADVGGEAARAIPTERAAHPVVQAFLEKSLVLVEEREAAELYPPGPAGPPIVRGALVPLVYQEERIGVLSLGLRRGSASWPADLVGRLALLADSGAIALHNARTMRIIEQQTERDGQTGLYNRISILKRLESEIRRAERSGNSLAIAHLRVDGLADAHQRFGAAFGDALLPKAAAYLVRATRAVNVVGRDKGDRFWILVFDATKAQAHKAMESIRKNFETALDPRLDPAGVRLGLTSGLAAYPEDAFDTASLILRAEEALDDACRSGPGSVVLYGALSEAESEAGG